ncbi:MAG TPA: carboxypeptidase-like regulatory domain-containing protein, partial [Gemmatimonadaceae bacterium]|nr:carboxypeptidase-like regulatory domain-containing protein [Gemmatimonadaceae bacterium]
MRWHALLPSLVAVALVPAIAQGQSGRITGTVTEAQAQQPLPGVTVTLIGRDTARASTNAQGEFLFPRVTPGTYTVRTLVLGYVSANQAVSVADGQTATVRLALERAAVTLDAVVSIGYGTVQRKEVTGS